MPTKDDDKVIGDNKSKDNNNNEQRNQQPSREGGNTEVVCCKHGKPCQLSSARTGAEVPKSPGMISSKDYFPGVTNSQTSSITNVSKEQQLQQQQQLKARKDGPPSSAQTEKLYDNLPESLYPKEDAKARASRAPDSSATGSGRSAEREEKSVSSNSENSAGELGGHHVPSVELLRQRMEEERLYEDITSHPGSRHKCDECKKLAVAHLPKHSMSRFNMLPEGQKLHEAVRDGVRNDVPSLATVVISSGKLHDKNNPKEQLNEFYAGACSTREAERQYEELAKFRLYHRVVDSDEDRLQSVLPLYLVFKSSNGKYCHVRVVRAGKDLLKLDADAEPKFRSLSQLVTFYDVYAAFNNQMDPFPRKCNTDPLEEGK